MSLIPLKVSQSFPMKSLAHKTAAGKLHCEEACFGRPDPGISDLESNENLDRLDTELVARWSSMTRWWCVPY
jgi:hypothetical protein